LVKLVATVGGRDVVDGGGGVHLGLQAGSILVLDCGLKAWR
jgi:hypothetical protein